MLHIKARVEAGFEKQEDVVLQNFDKHARVFAITKQVNCFFYFIVSSISFEIAEPKKEEKSSETSFNSPYINTVQGPCNNTQINN